MKKRRPGAPFFCHRPSLPAAAFRSPLGTGAVLLGKGLAGRLERLGAKRARAKALARRAAWARRTGGRRLADDARTTTTMMTWGGTVFFGTSANM